MSVPAEGAAEGQAKSPIIDEPDAILDIDAPAAYKPALPTAASRGRLSGEPLTFARFAAGLEQFSEAGKLLQDVASTAKRLTLAATARLHAGDESGAASLLAQVAELPTPSATMGPSLWGDTCTRLKLCQQISWTVEAQISCLGFQSFLLTGVLTPPLPDSCKTDLAEHDDERYLIGLMGAVRELERYGINRGQALDLQSITRSLEAVQCFHHAMQQFDFRNSELRKRFDGIKYTVRKLEHLAYEVGLALQRKAEGADVADPQIPTATVLEPSPAQALAIDLPALADTRARYVQFDAARESVLKQARDVLKGAKNAVYDTQRSKLASADKHLAKAAKDANQIHAAHVVHYPALRGGLFGAALEELVEGIAVKVFSEERRLPSFEDVQKLSGLGFPLSLPEYLGGVLDLTGEVGRMAIKASARGRDASSEIELHLECISSVYAAAKELPYLPGGLGKKMGHVHSTLLKVETALYELALLSKGMRPRVKSEPHPGEACPEGDDAEVDGA